jgi:hypothetical protein
LFEFGDPLSESADFVGSGEEIDTGHDLMITEAERTAEMLLRLADQDKA